jgi:hypothetical protein
MPDVPRQLTSFFRIADGRADLDDLVRRPRQQVAAIDQMQRL